MKVAELLERWDQADSPPSMRTLYHLSGLEATELASFKEGWAGLPVERRRIITKGLVGIVENSFEVDFTSIFRHLLSDSDPEVRAHAVEGLFEEENLWLLRALVSMLAGDPSSLVRAHAAMALGRFALLAEMEELDGELSQELRRALLAAIHSSQEDLEVRRRAMEAIAYFGDGEVRQIIADAYHHPARKMRVSAIFAMGRTLDPHWKKTLLVELENEDAEIRYEAARACGELELKAAVPILAPLLYDPDREVQESAVWALGQIGGNEARRLLAQAASSADEPLAEAAAQALSELEFSTGLMEIPISEDDEE